MTDDVIRVETSDNQVLEVKSAIAKQWAPIKMSESKIVSQEESLKAYDYVSVLKEEEASDKPVQLTNVNAEVLNKVWEFSIGKLRNRLEFLDHRMGGTSSRRRD